jgi:hypothetical protein
MPTLTDSITSAGAIVSIEVGVGAAGIRALHTARRPVPPPRAAQALLDTGAEMTCVDSSLIRSLAIPVGGSVLVNLPAHGGLTLGTQHDVSLNIVHPSGNPYHNLVIRDLRILDVSLTYLGYQALLGRDVLATCRLLYNGPRNRFRLAW